MTNYPGRGKVAVLKTSPATVLDDIERLMKLAGKDWTYNNSRERLL